jgi:hypothetical protein
MIWHTWYAIFFGLMWFGLDWPWLH